MKFTPHPYQRRAIRFIIEHTAAALFLDMGLGKSVITLTAIQTLRDDYFEDGPALVVAPKKVAESTWGTEAAKWDHLSGLRVVTVAGDARRRRAALATPADVYVIGRDNFVWLVGEMGPRLPFGTVVLDELTSFKSRGSQRFKAFRLVRPHVRNVIGLTGTPAPNGLLDLWAQMYCIDGGARLGKSFTRFRAEFFDCIEHNHIVIKAVPRPGAREAIMGRIADITLTMTAADYLTLPPLSVVDVAVTLPPRALADYRRMERDQVLEWKSREASGDIVAGSAAALINKLAQMASGTVYADGGHAVECHGEKLDALAELVESAASPVLVYYQYRSDVPRILARLRHLRVAVYEGDATLRAWNAGALDVLLAHPASTAYGLNMQAGGHYIVWYTPGWDLELYQQANARLYRQGQTRPVTVYRLLSAGTVDERIAASLEGKRSGQSAVLGMLKDMEREMISVGCISST